MGAFLDVIFRGVALAAQSLVIGSALFVIIVLRPWFREPRDSGSEASPRKVQELPTATRRARLVIIGAALIVAAAQSATLIIALATLADGGDWPVSLAFSTAYFRTGVIRLVLAIAAAVLGMAIRGRARAKEPWWAIAAVGVGLIVAAAGTSHAAGRLESRAILMSLDALHQLAAGVWIGGLALLIVSGGWKRAHAWSADILPRFSALALSAVTALVVAGVALTTFYIDGPNGLLGTAYGVMVLTKVLVLGGLLVLGAANFRAVRALRGGEAISLDRLKRYVEIELGLGFTVLLAASSLTSLPPARDVITDRATLTEVGGRFTPQWPTLTSPRHEELPAGDRDAPRTDEDRAWSEYNHHVAGLFVLSMGLLALANETTKRRWTRHWPLLFLGLGAFLLIRDDPGAWPLGPLGFWESMLDPAVLQHRFFVLLVATFGIFEWMVRTGRLRSPRAPFVFPLLCAAGGAVLLTHSHAMLNLKSEFLIEITHTPLALLGTVVGWGRWLALRSSPPDDRLPGRLSTVALALVGVVLLLYRES